MDNEFDKVLAECLARIEAGESSVPECLARYPQYQELSQLLGLALAVRAVPDPEPDLAWFAASRARIEATASQGQPIDLTFQVAPLAVLGQAWRWIGNTAAALAPPALAQSRVLQAAVLLVLAILGYGTASVSSADSLPGSPLYTVKRWNEQARLVAVADPGARAALHLEFALTRIREMEVQSSVLHEPAPVQMVRALQTEVLAARIELAQVPKDRTLDQVNSLARQIQVREVEFKGTVERAQDGSLVVSGMSVHLAPAAEIMGNLTPQSPVQVRVAVQPDASLTALSVRVLDGWPQAHVDAKPTGSEQPRPTTSHTSAATTPVQTTPDAAVSSPARTDGGAMPEAAPQPAPAGVAAGSVGAPGSSSGRAQPEAAHGSSTSPPTSGTTTGGTREPQRDSASNVTRDHGDRASEEGERTKSEQDGRQPTGAEERGNDEKNERPAQGDHRPRSGSGTAVGGTDRSETRSNAGEGTRTPVEEPRPAATPASGDPAKDSQKQGDQAQAKNEDQGTTGRHDGKGKDDDQDQKHDRPVKSGDEDGKSDGNKQGDRTDRDGKSTDSKPSGTAVPTTDASANGAGSSGSTTTGGSSSGGSTATGSGSSSGSSAATGGSGSSSGSSAATGGGGSSSGGSAATGSGSSSSGGKSEGGKSDSGGSTATGGSNSGGSVAAGGSSAGGSAVTPGSSGGARSGDGERSAGDSHDRGGKSEGGKSDSGGSAATGGSSSSGSATTGGGSSPGGGKSDGGKSDSGGSATAGGSSSGGNAANAGSSGGHGSGGSGAAKSGDRGRSSGDSRDGGKSEGGKSEGHKGKD